MGFIEFIALLILLVVLFFRNFFTGFLIIAIVWLAAFAFNPPVNSNFVWFIAFALAVVPAMPPKFVVAYTNRK